jgi:hypothetical protein
MVRRYNRSRQPVSSYRFFRPGHKCVYLLFLLQYFQNNFWIDWISIFLKIIFLYSMNRTDCIYYTFTIKQLFLPSPQLLYKLCVSYDKTKLFIVSTIRLFIIASIFQYLLTQGIMVWDRHRLFRTSLFLLVLLYLIINILYIPIILLKSPAMDKDELDNTVIGLAETVYENRLVK